MTDFAASREMMVDTQVRPSDVTKFPIIDAMLTIRREAFVPQEARATAYMGDNIVVGPGRVILEPRTLAKMLDALNPDRDALVLDIGPSGGYSSAVLSRLCDAVVAVEDDEARANDVQATLMEEGCDNVAVVAAALHEGAPKHGPYDAITIQGGVEQVSQALLDQLNEGGRIAAIFVEGALGECRIGLKSSGRISWTRVFNCGAPVLPGFEKSQEFAF